MTTTRTPNRTLGRSGIEVSPLGMGCWAIGGPLWHQGEEHGWGAVDDDESIRAIHAALELGVTFFDTADQYGCGHSERVLGRALAARQENVVVATKFGHVFNEETREFTHRDANPEYVRRACEDSLRRLGRDVIDLYQFHLAAWDIEESKRTQEVLEQLATEGKIKYYGWSTDDPERAASWLDGPHYTAVQQGYSLFGGNRETLTVCEENNLASILRGPLAMGLLTGKFGKDFQIPDGDVRRIWNGDMRPNIETMIEKTAELRGVLTHDGRTLAQAAIGWLWAYSPNMIPIPGFKSVAQVEDNAAALEKGPLSPEQMAEVDRILGR